MEYYVWRPSNEKTHVEKSQKKHKKHQKESEQREIHHSQQDNIVQDGFTNKFNKRNMLNNKLNERYMTGQVSRNPFMNNNDYIEDIRIQDEFLVPKNSNYENSSSSMRSDSYQNFEKNPYE